MDPVKYSIEKPVSVAVAVILIVMFGLIGINKLPVQLTPDVENPQITVSTVWPGATPYEVESEIIQDQEDALKSVKGLTKLESSSLNSMGNITLTFAVGTDLDNALLRVSNKLDEVKSYPQNVDKPVIDASGAESSPVIWMMLKTKDGDPTEIRKFRTFFEDEVRQYVERVPGVGSLFVFGGTEEQCEVIVDRAKLARYGISISHVINRLTAANRNVSAGLIGVSKKDYRLRTVSQFEDVVDVLNVVLLDDGTKSISLRQVADVQIGYETSHDAVMFNDYPVIVVGVKKEQGANVIDLTDRIRDTIAGLNEGVLGRHGLELEIAHEQTGYINNAIDIVQVNVLIGGILAVFILLLFLRSVTSTLTVAIAIPISVIGTFIFMWLMGRNINVVSLAGISFAVGMLVDNSIVVLENIDRHRGMGKSPFAAAYEGAKEVWGAVLASTLTTIAVFLPVIFIEEEAGQLFRDIAIAVTFAITLSLFVSVSVIPSLIYQFYRLSSRAKKSLGVLDAVGSALNRMILFFSNLSLSNVGTRIATVIILPLAAVILAWSLMPKAEYLPQGNRNLIFNILLAPPGYSRQQNEEIGHYIFAKTRPHFEQDYVGSDLPGTEGLVFPKISRMFYVAASRFNGFGAISEHETEAGALVPLFQSIINSIPGMYGVSIQVGIFQGNIGAGRNIDVDINGPDINKNLEVARAVFGMSRSVVPGCQARPIPSIELSYPEANVIPDSARLAANGMNEFELGQYVDIVMDGRQIGDYKPEGKKAIDLVVKTDDDLIRSPEDVMNSLISNPDGKVFRIGDVSKLEYGQGMTQINHIERKRNITVQITPPKTTPLQSAMEDIQAKIIEPLRASGKLEGVNIDIGGNADKLTETRQALQWNFLLALLITYLLLAALLESFLYPLIIMVTVPLAAAGGFLGLKLENLMLILRGTDLNQPFDILTMLGFVMLIGMVVNNAILIVYQALNYVRHEKMDGIAAIKESVRTRIRPIFMSTLTSLLGFMPMVLSIGPGSELYRGIGSVILGGLLVSTVFTILVTPALLSFVIGREVRKVAEAGK